MTSKRKTAGKTPVDSYKHDETRLNIPTADAATSFFDEEGQAQRGLRYPRDVSLDPQLVWKGKDEQDGRDLVVDAPPIYIQEKIVPRALIENLRETAKTGEEEPEVTLFEMFDDLDDLSQVEFYQHEESWKNRMILGDSLQVMGSLAERESLRGRVQMIYLDPPYGIKFGSNWQVRTGKRDVRDGNLVDAAREAEQIKAFRDTWELGIHSYLSYLRDRLIAARDLLTESGSVFVQIGDENVHLVRSLLDEVFGSQNNVALIPWKKTSAVNGKLLDGVNDYLLWYAKNKESMKYRQLYTASEATVSAFPYVESDVGDRRATAADTADGRFRTDNLTSQGGSATSEFEVELDGHTYWPSRGAHWKTNVSGMNNLKLAGRLVGNGKTLAFRRYFSDFPVRAITNWWDDTVQSTFAVENLYVVQTYSKVIERCMLMCTDPGDLVIDPTCGSGTTAFVAERQGRRWITIDTSRVAIALARQRIMGARYPYFMLADSDIGRQQEGLMPSTTSGAIRNGFVYKKVQHITLRSIVNNPDLSEGLSRAAIDETIRRHADFELLYDQPIEEKSKVRVSGPFTVETLSPHRSLSLEREHQALEDSADSSESLFEKSVIQNLRAAGIQNGRRSERIEFQAITEHSGAFIQAIGLTRDEFAEPIAIALGPQYGTVSANFIKQAAREAIEAGAPMVAVLGFAFDAQLGIEADEEGFAVVAGVRDLGKVKVLVVRMNVDLLMGEELKKTGTGNLFTVFGEPDLDLRRDGEKWVVEVCGVDVYDPTSGHIRSSSTKEVALWMVDSNYDGESFFVRHAYFLGENDPYKALKTALKADINPEAWATLYRSVSVPFEKPETGKIAVKVINDYGDEVMKVLEVN